MEENEGKNLAQDMKKEQEKTEKYYENVRLELSKIVLDNVTIGEKQSQTQKENGVVEETVTYEVLIDFKGEKVHIATIDADGHLTPNEAIMQDEKYSEEDRKKLGDMLNLLGLQQDEVDMNKLQEQLKTIDAKTKEELEQEKGEKSREEDETIKDETERDDEEEEPEKDKEAEDIEKEKIAKKYNVNSNQVVHINMKDEKITEDDTFQDLVKWADGKEDIFVIPDKDMHTYKVVGKQKGEEGQEEYTEIEEATKQIHGKNPDVTIKRIDGEKITEVQPLAMYDIDGESTMAVVEGQYGEREVLYCRKEEGEQKYWGAVVPEVSGKNVRQMDFDERSFMSSKNTSSMDLDKKAGELAKAQDLNDRGLPSKEKGVQVYEIDGNSMQNHEMRKEEVVADLMKRDGIVDKLTVPPGYYEHKADKVLLLLEENEQMEYDEAVEKVEAADKREEGGRTPGDDNRRRE